ncbi:MAG: membrane integrity-associated transporter subunit PqiC, partial [Syntrophaceae bacterium]|nr:membrane integrity-associated transporter subunit PqiC [Syntrophaceae bacterium]
VGPVLIPPVVDRPQMVTRLNPSRIQIDEFNRWAVPLQKEIARIIAENLVNQLGSPRVTLFPQSPPDASAIRVSIDFLKFEAAADQSVTLDAQWTVRTPGDGKTAKGRKTLKEPWVGAGYDDRIAAYNHALERLSGEIAQSLLAL